MNVKDIIGEHMVSHLLKLCKQELNLEELPPIKLLNNTDSIGGSSFGVFDGAIKVVTKNRHPVDIMRTLAHEVVHWKQRSEGEELDGTTGSDTENEANAVAGIIMRKFGEKYPDYYINTLD